MIKEYNSNSEREYTAPEAQGIVEPESSLPKWVKRSIMYLTLPCLFLNVGGFFAANLYRVKGMSKSEIEERIDKNHRNTNGLVRFVFDDFTKPGRELAYLISGSGKEEK